MRELIRRGLEFPPELVPFLPRPLSFRQFVDRVRPGYRWFRHCVVLAGVLQRVADGDLKRVMIFMPPRHGKSELASRLFPAYLLYRFPHRWIGLCSYGAELAQGMARQVRDHYERSGGRFRADANAIKHAETPAGGGIWAAGVGGPILGKGYHVGIIDDPVKNAEEALSPTIQTKHRDWYASTFTTREMPDLATGADVGAQVIILQRWSDEDLAGWLLAQEAAEAADPDGDPEDLERWHVVNFEAIKEAEAPPLPPSCTLEPDWREVGEPLCPEIRSLKKLRKLAKRLGSFFWSALFQQRPRPREGLAFQASWIRRWEPAGEGLIRLHRADGSSTLVQLAHCRRFATADVAASLRTSADWTVIAVWLVTRESDLILYHLVRARTATPASLFHPVHLEYSPAYFAMGANGLGLPIIHELRRGFRNADGTSRPGLAIHGINETLDKLSNAQTAIVRMEAGQVFLPLACPDNPVPWLPAFEAELLSFPNASHDDQVDCLSHAANHMFWAGGAGEPAELVEAREQAEREEQEEAHYDVDNPHWWGDDE